MSKLFGTLVFLVLFHLTISAQENTLVDKQSQANRETKTELVSKLNYSSEIAEKILGIENEFFASLSQTIGLPEATEIEKKAKRTKVHEAQVIRRSKLMEIPLTGRQMEDVIELSEGIRRKHKL